MRCWIPGQRVFYLSGMEAAELFPLGVSQNEINIKLNICVKESDIIILKLLFGLPESDQ